MTPGYTEFEDMQPHENQREMSEPEFPAELVERCAKRMCVCFAGDLVNAEEAVAKAWIRDKDDPARDEWQRIVIAVLRESGYSEAQERLAAYAESCAGKDIDIAKLREIGMELIAALKDALPYVKAHATFAVDKRAQAIAQECNGALAKASAL